MPITFEINQVATLRVLAISAHLKRKSDERAPSIRPTDPGLSGLAQPCLVPKAPWSVLRVGPAAPEGRPVGEINPLNQSGKLQLAACRLSGINS